MIGIIERHDMYRNDSGYTIDDEGIISFAEERIDCALRNLDAAKEGVNIGTAISYLEIAIEALKAKNKSPVLTVVK
jgi:hypothetical protein